jgi:hypothetical protein
MNAVGSHQVKPISKVRQLSPKVLIGRTDVVEGTLPMKATVSRAVWQAAALESALRKFDLRSECLELLELLGEHAIARADFCQHALEIFEAFGEGLAVIHAWSVSVKKSVWSL